MPKFKVLVSRIELHCPIGKFSILLPLDPFFSIESFISTFAVRKISKNVWGVDLVMLYYLR